MRHAWECDALHNEVVARFVIGLGKPFYECECVRE